MSEEQKPLEVQFEELVSTHTRENETVVSEFGLNIALFIDTVINERIKFKEEEFNQLRLNYTMSLDKVKSFADRGKDIQDKFNEMRNLILSFRDRLENRIGSLPNKVDDGMLAKFESHFKIDIDEKGN